MSSIDRRAFLAASGAAASGAAASCLAASGTTSVDETLRAGIARRKIPCVVGMAATAKGTLYAAAFGHRDNSGAPVHIDSIFQVMSMTKAVTTVAALQLMEQGKVTLDEPVARHLPQFEKIQVLAGFDSSGAPQLRPAATPPTLRHLLTHTSGLCYDLWDADLLRYNSHNPGPRSGPDPLMFEPGTRWMYGRGVDWAGRLVEAISGLTLEDYSQRHILQPLGMVDTSYILPEAKLERWVSNHRREKDGLLHQDERKLPAAPKSFNGGGGLYSTAADYVRFMQMILNQGAGPNKVRILQQKSVKLMETNQIGELTAGKMKTSRPNLSSDVDIHPGHAGKWTLGFLLNTTPYEGGRSAGSLAWAGLNNTYFWIDPKRTFCAVILMQFLPFVDKEAVGLLNDFERAIYGAGLFT